MLQERRETERLLEDTGHGQHNAVTAGRFYSVRDVVICPWAFLLRMGGGPVAPVQAQRFLEKASGNRCSWKSLASETEEG